MEIKKIEMKSSQWCRWLKAEIQRWAQIYIRQWYKERNNRLQSKTNLKLLPSSMKKTSLLIVFYPSNRSNIVQKTQKWKMWNKDLIKQIMSSKDSLSLPINQKIWKRNIIC